MIHLVYVSAAVLPVAEADLVDILRTSRVNNERAGVTGLLLYSGGTFFQVLEGDERVVKETFERIGRDSRHNGISILLREEIRERVFGQWAMGFARMGDLAEADRAAFSSLLERREGEKQARVAASAEGRTRSLLRGFCSMAALDLH
jgi:hypothetical protein